MEDFTSLIRGKIEALRPKLQDTSRRNPLINNVLTAKSSAFVRIVDEKPQSILDSFLSTEKADLRLIPLPPTDIDPPDEDTNKFRSEVQTAQVTDSEYLADIEKLDFENDKQAIDKQEKALRELKDRLRVQLGMPPRPRAEQFADLNNHALAHGINPDSSLHAPDAEAVDDRFQDDNLQTLLLPKTFQSRMARILSKARSYQEERGLDVVYLVLGYLKWTLPNAAKGDEFKSPLLLLPANLERTRSKEGEVYRVSRRGDPLLNPSLMHKLWTEANLDLSDIRGMVTAEEVDVEKLFSRLADLSPANMRWSVQREASFGIYPFQGIELYNDLDTSDCDFSKFPIVSQLLIGKSEQDRAGLSSFSEADVESDLGKKLVPHIVLDADSSQFIALLRVANSENVALEGPPGSGKSQTIVNAIANAVHAGKKVLFVAQKATALEVVYSRLQALNLEKFVLPLLGGGSNEEFFQSLADRILSEPLELQRDSAALAARYATLSSRLASYIDVLTKPIEGTGMSVHQAMGLAIRYKQPVNDLPPDFSVIKIDIARYTKTFLPSDLRRLVAAVAELVARLQESSLSTDSVWQEATADAINIDNVHSLLLNASSAILSVQGLVA